MPFSFALDAKYRSTVPNVDAWVERIAKIPSVVKFFGHVKRCEQAVLPVDFKGKITLSAWTEGHFFAMIPLMVAGLAGVDVDFTVIDKSTRESASYKKEKAHWLFPLCTTAEGEQISESAAISSYLAAAGKPELLGKTAFEKAQVDQWLCMQTSAIFPNIVKMLLA